MIITDIIQKNNRIIGYRVSNGVITEVMSRQKVIDCIEDGRITNVTVQHYKDGRVRIRENDFAEKKQKVKSKVKSNGTISENIAISVKLTNGEKVELSGLSAVKILDKLSKGTPLKIKLSTYSDWKQAIFIGSTVNKDTDTREFIFFDGQGVTGAFKLSGYFIEKKGISILFNDNDPVELNFLVKAQHIV